MPSEPVSARDSGLFPGEIWTVSALARSVRDLLEHRYPLLWVSGEISNCVRAKSGHLYFSLKDEAAQVRCVMFRNRNQYLDWDPQDGMRVEARALLTLYEARGDFQLNIESLRQAGQGALFAAFLRLRERLAREGLFEQARKKPLPRFPRRIGIVTSLQAAALRDVLTTLARRNPAIPIVIYPAPVQGEGAAQQLIDALARAIARDECDVLVLCRGGGSIEDLWAFNDEALARALYASPIPIVTGIGHETDFTIADFVADTRAATPTAAAELVAPARDALLAEIESLRASLQRHFRYMLESRAQRLDALTARLQSPAERLALQAARLQMVCARLGAAGAQRLRDAGWRLSAGLQRLASARPNFALHQQRLDRLRLAGLRATHDLQRARAVALDKLQLSLAHLDPHAVLGRGYAIARTPEGQVVRSSSDLRADDALELTFARGGATVRVERPH